MASIDRELEQHTAEIAALLAPPAQVSPIARPVNFDVASGIYSDSITGEVIGDEGAFHAWLGPAVPVRGPRSVVFELAAWPENATKSAISRHGDE